MTRFLTVTAMIIGLALTSACGDSDNTTIVLGNDLDPAPGTFTGATSNGGAVTILVGSIDRIDLECGGQTFVGSCNPPVEVGPDGAVMDSCGDISFDLIFSSGGNSVSGSVSAGSSCDGDLVNVTRVGGQPTAAPTPTPTDGGNPTSTPGPVETPSPTPTESGGGGEDCTGQSVIVGVSLETLGVNIAGATVRIDYPTGSVDIPGSVNEATVQARVQFQVPAALRSVNDADSNDDGIDDRLNLSVTGTTPFSPVDFADVTFDCIGPEPNAGSFVCTATAGGEFGEDVPTTCNLTVGVQ